VYTAVIIFIIVSTSRFSFFFQFDNIGLYIGLLCCSALNLYVGYIPITTNEVEQKRQANRMRKLKEAHGAMPLGYIFQEVIFPIILGLIFIFSCIGLILFLTSRSLPVHLPLPVVLVGCRVAIVFGLVGICLDAMLIYLSLKKLPHVARQRQDELRQQLTDHEFDL
jgi:hypothetical protein